MKHTPPHVLFLVLVPTLAACEHEAELPEPHLPPVASIIFSSPVEGAVYNRGDTVTIEALAVSSQDIHGYTVFINKAADTTTFYHLEGHAHNDSLLIRHQWLNTLTGPATALEARITLILDHEGNTQTENREFRHER